MDDLRELEAQADEERRQIVGKYAAGRARTDHIDDWEDPGRYDYKRGNYIIRGWGGGLPPSLLSLWIYENKCVFTKHTI